MKPNPRQPHGLRIVGVIPAVTAVPCAAQPVMSDGESAAP